MANTRVEYSLTDKELRELFFGADAAMQMKLFLEGKQEKFDKDYLIRKLKECYENRMNQIF